MWPPEVRQELFRRGSPAPRFFTVSTHWGRPLRGPQTRRPLATLDRPATVPALHRLRLDSPAEARPQGALAREPALARVEAALFAAEEPLTPRKLATVAGLADVAEARQLVRKLQGFFDQEGSAFQVEEIAGGFQMLTRPEFHPWLVRLKRAGAEVRLTGPMRETLAIVAYRQPIMRADIEKVRGVQSAEVLRQLMEKGLLRIAGRDTSLGRPVLYGTTKKFLQVYGLKSLRELPQVAQLKAPQPAEE